MSDTDKVTTTDLLQALEDASNLMTGMQFDRRIDQETRNLLLERARRIDTLLEGWFAVDEHD